MKRFFYLYKCLRPEISLHKIDLFYERQDKCKKQAYQRDYNLGFKLALVSEVEKGNYTYKQIQKEYGIQGRSTVLVWLRKYGNLDWAHQTTSYQNKKHPLELWF